jgi:hypothetical protein
MNETENINGTLDRETKSSLLPDSLRAIINAGKRIYNTPNRGRFGA